MSKGKPNVGARPVEDNLSIDTIHHLLSARRRRYVLYYLYLYENPVRLPDVADRVTEWERNDPDLEDRLHAYNELYHAHIPKLADAAVVIYYQKDDMIELAQNAAQLRPHLEQAAEADLDAMDI